MTVYIVEDDPGVSDSLQTYIMGLGHDAIVCPDAETFLERAPPAEDDTIIVDLLLPGISGADVIRWLFRLRNPPRIIAISGQAQSVIDRQLAGLADRLSVMRKPLSPTLIASIV